MMKKVEQPSQEKSQSPESQIINFEHHDPVYFTKLVAYCSDQVIKIA